MRIFHVLDKIENAIYNSRKIPLLKNYAIVRQDKLLSLIEKTRQSLPEEMKQARWVSKENQRILQEAQSKAGEIVRDSEKRSQELMTEAKEESRRLLDKELIVVNAKERAQEILDQAKGEAEALIKSAEAKARDTAEKAREEAEFTKNGADQYALKVLNGMEKEFTRVLEIIKMSREALLPPQQAPRSQSMEVQREKPRPQSVELPKEKPRPEPVKQAPAPPAPSKEQTAQQLLMKSLGAPPPQLPPRNEPLKTESGPKTEEIQKAGPVLTFMGPGPNARKDRDKAPLVQKPGLMEKPSAKPRPGQSLPEKQDKLSGLSEKPALPGHRNASPKPGLMAKPGFGKEITDEDLDF